MPCRMTVAQEWTMVSGISSGGELVSDWQSVRRMVLARDGNACVDCHQLVASQDADIHHLLPRSMGGSDEASNLVTLCDGCHAAHHPNLAGGLARRVIERWAMRIARLLDGSQNLPIESRFFGPGLRLMGVKHFRDGQLAVVEAALKGRSVLVVDPPGPAKLFAFNSPHYLNRVRQL